MGPFLAGMAAGAAVLAIGRGKAARRRAFDPRLIRRNPGADVDPVVVVPGIMGSGLCRPDGTPVWLNVRNALGHYNLSLPFNVPVCESRDDLVPRGLLGTDAVLPRLFGFTEYSDLLELLQSAGFRNEPPRPSRATYHVFAYDWRRDLVESVGRLHEALETLAEQRGDPAARFTVIGHSMGGLVARYYLRYGAVEPAEGMPVTWAGARRIRHLLLTAVPNGGAIHALEGILYGNRVGLSYTTLAAPVVARMPSVYQLLPPHGAPALVDHRLEPLEVDLHAVETWERFGWGPYAAGVARRLAGIPEAEREAHRAFLPAVLERARLLHTALAAWPAIACPARVVLLGGDCLPTLARALVPERPGLFPRFEPLSRAEADAMFDAGDGRVTRASVLALHSMPSNDPEASSGIPEVSNVFVGSTDHHGIYREPTFQSVVLRVLLQPAPRASAEDVVRAAAAAAADSAAERHLGERRRFAGPRGGR
jgi:pimeloyl-ACP methyl ester carboxylesterase